MPKQQGDEKQEITVTPLYSTTNIATKTTTTARTTFPWWGIESRSLVDADIIILAIVTPCRSIDVPTRIRQDDYVETGGICGGCIEESNLQKETPSLKQPSINALNKEQHQHILMMTMPAMAWQSLPQDHGGGYSLALDDMQMHSRCCRRLRHRHDTKDCHPHIQLITHL